MLQAMTRKKAESFLKRGSVRVPREDIMTDAVFGGVRYFDEQQAGVALHWLLPDLVERASTIVQVCLWPRRHGVEPDVVIDLRNGAGTRRRIIIEAKWLDNPLEAWQLDAQWNVFRPGTPGAPGEVSHVLLVQHRIRVDPAAYHEASQAMRRVRHLLTWRDLSAAAAKRAAKLGSPQVNIWMDESSG